LASSALNQTSTLQLCGNICDARSLDTQHFSNAQVAPVVAQEIEGPQAEA
jgi:hypothetical protein